MYHQFEPVTLEYLKQIIQLILIIKGGFILICSRHNELIHRVELKILHFHCVGKSRMNCEIILLHSTTFAALIELMIKELLNVIVSQLTESDTRIVNIKVLHESPVSTLICLIGSSCKVRTHCRQPLIHIFTHRHLRFGSVSHDSIRLSHCRNGCRSGLGLSGLFKRSCSELLVILRHDLIDRFFQSLLGAFLREISVYPLALTLSLAVLVVKNNILFSVLHGSDVLIRQTCFHLIFLLRFESGRSLLLTLLLYTGTKYNARLLNRNSPIFGAMSGF